MLRYFGIQSPKYFKLECGLMPNVMATHPNIRGAVYENSLIPFLVPRRKVWLRPAGEVSCSNAANILERKTWTQSNFARAKIPSGGKCPQNAYIVYQHRRRPKIVQSLVSVR